MWISNSGAQPCRQSTVAACVLIRTKKLCAKREWKKKRFLLQSESPPLYTHWRRLFPLKLHCNPPQNPHSSPDSSLCLRPALDAGLIFLFCLTIPMFASSTSRNHSRKIFLHTLRDS